MGSTITGKRARKLAEKGAVVVDVRNAVAFRDKSIPQSINMSLRQLGQLQKHVRTTPIIVVGDKDDKATLNAAVNYITLYGFTMVCTVPDFDSWDK